MVRMSRLARAVLALAWAGAACAIDAQSAPSPSPDRVREFIATARAAARRYEAQEAALADGYRAVGPDSPAMGQHWVHVMRLFDGGVDAARTQILTYIQVDGRPVLTGVAYATPARGEADLPEQPVGRAAWHVHDGALDEEAFLPVHHAAGAPGVGVAVLHLWISIENPDGAWAAENWALPFARLGLAMGYMPTARSASALSLATIGERFITHSLLALARADSAALRAMPPIVARHAADVRAWVAERGTAPVSAAEMQWLERTWGALWRDLESCVSPETWMRLAPARGAPAEDAHRH